MEIKVQVPFQQLLKLVKSLSPSQKARLRKELSEKNPSMDKKDEFIQDLLNGPVLSEEEIGRIEDNRKSIAAWRTKSK
ncbi:hypothetical protein G3O08_06455 [Cryomorpha ignava]|uniref:Uncharacterized protein n=1 Tax=Cryomorpha ignava TaxID=101383 RepID=A0A7K3WNN4_9FLAO|nr:hypothetical protein [Cryomorpha ignava]NEN23138.1 hypothetical protein [Cryomorpha ignava]